MEQGFHSYIHHVEQVNLYNISLQRSGCILASPCLLFHQELLTILTGGETSYPMLKLPLEFTRKEGILSEA